jgi:hypothetical protein
MVVASARTLEIKVSERGPDWMQRAAPPHIVTQSLRELLQAGDLQVVAEPRVPGAISALPKSPCKLFALANAPRGELDAALELRLYLEHVYSEHSTRARPTLEFGAETFGSAGEAAVREAVAKSGKFRIGTSWGDVKDSLIIGASDGLLYYPIQLNGVAAVAAILVEIKNKREWIYHDAWELWKHIRNAYAMDAIPLFVARRIYESAFEYVLKRTGGLGVEMRTQFAPSLLAEILADAADPYGLDYFDLRFTTTPGPRFCNRVNLLADQIATARVRMLRARPIVTPYLDELSRENLHRDERARLYWTLQRELNEAGIEPLSLLPE